MIWIIIIYANLLRYTEDVNIHSGFQSLLKGKRTATLKFTLKFDYKELV